MAARMSPTTKILRKSRLFALPASLSPPAQSLTSSLNSWSDTATLPYPTRAAIETPASSLARGDWGLKRPLPAKSTVDSSSNPLVRINYLDTYEHITDFHSANDHALTLKKYQELSLPISSTTHGTSSLVGSGRHTSVFESSTDNITASPDHSSEKKLRYRFKGPWLAGMTEIEFERYLKKVRKQRPEFLQKLREVVIENKALQTRRRLMDEGKSFEESDLPKTLSDAEFESALLALRADPAALGPEVNKFLDLATPPKVPDRRIHLRNWAAGPSDVASPQYARDGPPKTHPSAGLSYLRTRSHLENHPIAGPQQNPRPVQARLLRARGRGRGGSSKSIVGVAGFVTDDIGPSASRDFDSQKGSIQFDPDLPGGAKYWVKVEKATVDVKGKVLLRVDGATNSVKALYGVQGAAEALPSFVTNRAGYGRLDDKR
ncbi:hypothetical protein H112_08075 [Trichophyton rubrum D6]|uniref:Mitochondrial ribosomal protein MRP51 n=5 Tax=Trichophyton TaxID=5550 RepID=A0A178EU96_TRIRU|nr:uncharacterized protein TERG_00651 [Trichophyton rubrum CBS 118892]EZF10714.1 hypothetical protein H100_08103 [Trichophyton rubrum MR850]EZF37586.1 hypothetical protein H102_08059 [Trichophyton rubrum CBS 100081]EZF48154.1 hypothetical protein H103_08085 [Trichophyton rubrum CBS 288.86]EZF58876.1 hypothetical protein H104_08033 [Trichophyton rubrum CBS 289.86]EZF69409.1 hypothetical protein H105_08085 [Trichophyton soudanense CBS 452.61]EZF80156.1 hypothetical protein H110_08086 [Trichophy